MVITILKIGNGTEDNPFRPDTTSKYWQLISEDETTMTIETLDDTII